MGVEKDIIKYKDGKDLTSTEAINEYLDDEIETLNEKLDRAQAKSLDQMHIRLVSDEISITNTEEGPLMIVGIAKLDDNYYGAFFNPYTKKQYVEELDIKSGKSPDPSNIRGSRMIMDPTEWHTLAEFFISNHIFEMARIINWVLECKTNEDLRDRVKKMIWMEKVNKDLESKGRKPLTPDEVARKILKSGNHPRI